MITTICQNAPPFKAGPVEFPRGNPIQQGGYEWHPFKSPPLMGGDKGEGETPGLFTPTSILPHQGGGGCLGKFEMLSVSTPGVSLETDFITVS
jgi:hypothetical protein